MSHRISAACCSWNNGKNCQPHFLSESCAIEFAPFHSNWIYSFASNNKTVPVHSVNQTAACESVCLCVLFFAFVYVYVQTFKANLLGREAASREDRQVARRCLETVDCTASSYRSPCKKALEPICWQLTRSRLMSMATTSIGA